MSPQRSYAQRADSTAELIVIQPTVVLGGAARRLSPGEIHPPLTAARRRFELQCLLEEPLTVPLGSLHVSPAVRSVPHAAWRAEPTPPHYPAEVSHLHRNALQQNFTASQREAFELELTSPRRALHCARPYEEPPTAPARPTRAARAASATPQPWAARAAALRVLARHAVTAQPSAAHRAHDHWLTRAQVRPPSAPIRRALSPAHFPWQPNARLPKNASLERTARIHHRGAWTWPVALSLCSMLLAYAITARLLARSAAEHRPQASPAACR